MSKILWRARRGVDGEMCIRRFIEIARAAIGPHTERKAAIRAMLDSMPAETALLVSAELDADPVEQTQAEIAALLDRVEFIEAGLRDSIDPAPIAPLLHEIRTAMVALLALVVQVAGAGVTDAARRDRAVTRIRDGLAAWRLDGEDWVIVEVGADAP